MEINIGMSECHKNVDNYYGSHITVWIPRCAGREAFDGVEPLHGFVTVILQESSNPLKFTKYIFLYLCLFLSSCFHAVKTICIEDFFWYSITCYEDTINLLTMLVIQTEVQL